MFENPISHIPIDKITKEDLQTLIDNKCPETRTLEYKCIEELNNIVVRKIQNEKQEFCVDVLSFANAGGGDIIYGIKEDKNKLPSELEGLDITNINNNSKDGIDRALRDILNTHIIPKINDKDIDIRLIPINDDENKLYALIVRIKRSFKSPHCIKDRLNEKLIVFKKRIYGKNEWMDYDDLKQAFLEKKDLYKVLDEAEIINIQMERLKEIETKIIPKYCKELKDIPYFFLQIIPSYPINKEEVILKYYENFLKIKEILYYGYKIKKSSDCMISLKNPSDYKYEYYFNILTKDGILGYCYFFDRGSDENNKVEIHPNWIERQCLDFILEKLKVYKELSIDFPFNVTMIMINTKNCKLVLGTREHIEYASNEYILNDYSDDNKAIFSMVSLDNPRKDLGEQMRPLFNNIWEFFGLPKSHNYDKNGYRYEKNPGKPFYIEW